MMRNNIVIQSTVFRIIPWGYAKAEAMDTKDLLKVKYGGIWSAPGCPSQPDHTEKNATWELT
jgi:5-methyltetrahydrofolate--homocysteine methyltransferase